MARLGLSLGSLVAATLLAGCGVRLPNPSTLTMGCPTAADRPIAVGENALFFAATRIPDCRRGGLRFSGFRNEAVTYGISELDGAKDPWETHVSKPLEQSAWKKTLQNRLGANKGPLLVYIHGYYSTFEDALERGHKLSKLNAPGVPTVVVSWPSRNKVVSYTYDEASVEWTQAYFEQLLRELTAISGDITVVAHSMGNRAAIGAILELDRDPDGQADHIREVVLASPDVDRAAALRGGGYLDRLLKQPKRKVLVYTSFADRANRASHRAHGYARLGSSTCKFDVNYGLREEPAGCHLRLPADRLAIVETGLVHSGGFRHADFVDSCATRSDLALFLKGAQDFPYREKLERGGLVGWRINPELAKGVKC